MCQSQSNTIGNTMNGIEVFDMNPSFIAIGRLEPLQSFESRPNQAIGLPGNMPVLMCPVGASDAPSRSASARTMKGSEPPSSRTDFLSAPRACAAIAVGVR